MLGCSTVDINKRGNAVGDRMKFQGFQSLELAGQCGAMRQFRVFFKLSTSNLSPTVCLGRLYSNGETVTLKMRF